jgi:hypothetical protein
MLVLVGTALAATAACAELLTQSAPAPMVPPIKEVPPAVSQRQKAEAPILRCWQEGRLVVEQERVTLADVPAGAYVLRKKDRKGAPIYVFDLKNGLCIVSTEAVAIEPSR